ncbi:hypothetical protein V3C99_013910 [Haemonchus contortus]
MVPIHSDDNRDVLAEVTLNSEISMSIDTDDSARLLDQQRRQSILENLLNRQHDGDDVPRTTRFRGFVNVEPVMMMVAVSLGLYSTSSPLFMYWARCIAIATTKGGYDVENATAICAQLTNSEKDLQDEVEKDIASTKVLLQIANTIPTLVAAPLIGTWSDKKGRKNPLLYTLLGFLLYTTCQLMATLTYQYINIYNWYFAGEILIGITGGMGSIFGTSLAIVTDDCRHKLRPGSSTVPMRIGVASFVQSIGSILGTLGMSLLAVPTQSGGHLHRLSYIKSTSVQLSFALIALAYAFIMVRETHFPLADGYLYNRLDGASSTSHIEQPKSFITKVREYMCALVDVLTTKRPGWTRCCLIMSLFFIMVEFLALDLSLLFLLVKRPPFSWSDKTFSNFSVIRGVLFSLGMVLCPMMLTFVHWLGKDSLMIILGIAASATSFLLISCATTTMQIFLTAGLILLCGGIAPGYRSFLPRMVPKEQTARLLTVVSIIMAFTPMLSSLIFNPIFNATLGWWPGFAFFIGGILQLFVVAGQSGVHCLMRPQWLIEKRLKAQMNTHSLTVGDDYSGDIEQSRTTSSAAASSDLNIPGDSLEEEHQTIHM